jgi:translation initiation factor 1
MRTTTPHEADFCLSTRNFSAYSTETGRICPDCSQPVVQCQCAARKRALAAAIANGGGAAADGVLRVQRATQGAGRQKRDAGARLGFWLAAALGALAKQLKAACGSGGTAKDGVIEVQGDHVATVMAALTKLGYVVKRSGG